MPAPHPPYTDADGSDEGTLPSIDKGIFVKAEAIRALLAAGLAIVGPVAAGASGAASSPLQVAGADGSGNVRKFLTDTAGRLFVDGAYAEGGGAVSSGIGVMMRGAAASYNLRGDQGGVVTQGFALASSRWQYAGATGGITDTADVAVMSAGGAGVRNYMTAIQYLNTAGVAAEIVVKDGATVIWRGMAPATMTYPAVVAFPVPLKGTANTALNVAMLTTATATRVSAQGFQGT